MACDKIGEFQSFKLVEIPSEIYDVLSCNFFLLEIQLEKSPLIGGIYFTVQKVVNTTVSKNITSHWNYHSTTFGFA